MIFLLRVSVCVPVSILSCSCCCSLYKARSHTIPQSQWGRHETPLLEGTLSVQRHHYFTPAQLKAQSSHGAAQMEMAVQIEEQGQEQERIGGRSGARGTRRLWQRQRAHKNDINIMAKLRTSCRSRTQKQGLEMVSIKHSEKAASHFSRCTESSAACFACQAARPTPTQIPSAPPQALPFNECCLGRSDGLGFGFWFRVGPGPVPYYVAARLQASWLLFRLGTHTPGPWDRFGSEDLMDPRTRLTGWGNEDLQTTAEDAGESISLPHNTLRTRTGVQKRYLHSIVNIFTSVRTFPYIYYTIKVS
ncbi:uncharacterized protein LOC122818822 isoform X2 [Drosophila biarmipes]|uniref:uncharacterized protein LOC122818822 isoform X2 n=1 Tax=Drosophila biarmipes TaxID=125945 RepID=UPI0021CC89AA|nr:uncharacterized protein LOC122818822 isoform X2 [Drosophila biarmipes]